jgi:hypothetical protein
VRDAQTIDPGGGATKFSGGLVIYWTWNNSLSVIQQGIVMPAATARLCILPAIES